MPLFVCDKCHCIENTAFGRYWDKTLDFVKEKGKALCSECAPTTFKSGAKTAKYNGEWHNEFPKEKYNKNRHNPEDFIYIPKELLE